MGDTAVATYGLRVRDRQHRMRVELAYGDSGLIIDVPDSAVVVAPRQLDPVADAPAALRAALRTPTVGPPLRSRVRPGQTVAISVCDGTRPATATPHGAGRARRAGWHRRP